MVLLKGFDKDGFIWYTNYGSRKAKDLSENSNASLLFYWDGLNWQVRIEGSVQNVSEEESENYFHSRPRGSQIGAIASKQSTVIPGCDFLHQEYKELETKFSDGSPIPKPLYWGGYRLKPDFFLSFGKERHQDCMIGWFIMAYGGNQDLQLSNGSLLRIHDEEDFSTIHYFSVQTFVFMNFMVA